MSNQASANSYDAVIVGGGMAGLTAGAMLAKEGRQVLVVEKEDSPGGFVREIQHGPYRINPAIHAIMGCNTGGSLGTGVITAVLDHLDLRDRCEFVAIDPFYRAQFPDFAMDVPTGREAYLEAFTRQFPDDAEGLHSLVNLCSTIFREFMQLPSVFRWQDWARMPFRAPRVFRNGNSTVSGVIDRYLSDPRLKSVYAAVHPYLALPPSHLPFLLWAVMMASYIEQGAFHCRGGYSTMADAFAEGLTTHGGEIVLGTAVSRIRVAGGEVQGVTLKSGQEIASPYVVSTIDARVTFRDLFDEGLIPSSYMRKLSNLRPSLSVAALFIATDLDVQSLGAPKLTMTSPWDLENVYASARRGQPTASAIHIPTVIDPSLAPPGQHLVIAQCYAPDETVDLASAAGDQIGEALLDHAEQVVPGVRTQGSPIAVDTEHAQSDYPLYRLGPMYGWANTASQVATRRLRQRSPLSGLYLAGHWTQPGSGVWTVVLSGINAARFILGENMSRPVWPLGY